MTMQFQTIHSEDTVAMQGNKFNSTISCVPSEAEFERIFGHAVIMSKHDINKRCSEARVLHVIAETLANPESRICKAFEYRDKVLANG